MKLVNHGTWNEKLKKRSYLIEVNVRKPLGVSILKRIKELRLYNVV
jgi:hypothetical protein